MRSARGPFFAALWGMCVACLVVALGGGCSAVLGIEEFTGATEGGAAESGGRTDSGTQDSSVHDAPRDTGTPDSTQPADTGAGDSTQGGDTGGDVAEGAVADQVSEPATLY